MIYSDRVPFKRKMRKKGLNAIKASRAANSPMISRVGRVCRGTTRCTARNPMINIWFVRKSERMEKKKKKCADILCISPFCRFPSCAAIWRGTWNIVSYIFIALKVDFDSWLAPPALEGRVQTTASTRAAADWSAEKKSQPRCQETAMCFLEAEIHTE